MAEDEFGENPFASMYLQPKELIAPSETTEFNQGELKYILKFQFLNSEISISYLQFMELVKMDLVRLKQNR